MKTPYSHMKRDCQYLLGLDEKDIEKFIENANIKSGMKILDAMCGNGILSKNLFKIKGIKLTLLDNSEFQINIAKNEVKNVNFVIDSILKTPFKEEEFDRIFIRNGIYEMPKISQKNLFKEVKRILKKEGLFFIWTFHLNKDNQNFFQEYVRKKDNLAEFDNLVSKRYFMTKEEIRDSLLEIGLKPNFINLNINYNMSTKKSCKIDFKGNTGKLRELNELNEYVRNLNLPHKGIELIDNKDNIQLKIPTLICVAKK